MTLKWGSTTVTAVKWGSTTCTAVYWGSTLVFPGLSILGTNKYAEVGGSDKFYSNTNSMTFGTGSVSISGYTATIKPISTSYYSSAMFVTSSKISSSGYTKVRFIFTCTLGSGITLHTNLSLYTSLPTMSTSGSTSSKTGGTATTNGYNTRTSSGTNISLDLTLSSQTTSGSFYLGTIFRCIGANQSSTITLSGAYLI